MMQKGKYLVIMKRKMQELMETIMNHLPIPRQQKEQLIQFLKFGIVGLSNTLISYVVYVLLIAIGVHYLFSSIMGFLASVINAYYWNSKYVFNVDVHEKGFRQKAFIKTFLSYAGTGLVLNNILLWIWIDFFKAPELLGPIINLFITVPLNYLLNKFWAFKK